VNLIRLIHNTAAIAPVAILTFHDHRSTCELRSVATISLRPDFVCVTKFGKRQFSCGTPANSRRHFSSSHMRRGHEM